MKVRQIIVATVLNGFNGERSIYGAFHLLKGKKSAQTIQDGALFGLNSYFGLFPEITRAEVEADVCELIENGQVTLLEQDRYVLTKLGQVALRESQDKNPYIRDLRGWQYHSYTEEVWLRISLFVQALTNITSGIKRFYPITHDVRVQAWVKNHLPTKGRQAFQKALYNELFEFLSSCNQKQALLFVHQLSGMNQIGLTRLQLAEKLGVSLEEVNLYHVSTIHRLLYALEENEGTFSYLSIFSKDLKKEFVLTQSARLTYELLEEGKTLESISRIRHLKQSTIEDHIVEIAISNRQFSIKAFVPEEIEESILRFANTSQTSRLRELKDKLEPEVSYFMIRLVLARKKVNDET